MTIQDPLATLHEHAPVAHDSEVTGDNKPRHLCSRARTSAHPSLRTVTQRMDQARSRARSRARDRGQE